MQEQWREGNSGPYNLVHYVWGRDLSGTLDGAGGVGGLLATEVGGVWYFPLYDNNGNVTDYVSETGDVVASYEYDAFGRTLSATGSMASAFPFRFSTKYFDAESGLYYYGYRYYSLELGRWITRDPIEEDGGDNLYAMCQNNTILFVDADGRKLYEWNAVTARELLVKTIDDFRKRGWDFAADALSHFLNGTRNNIDLSRYSNDISSNSGWRQFFLNNVSSKLNMGDKDKKIGDIDHEENFSKDLSSINFTTGVFNAQFDYRFHRYDSGNLFYALYGSRYSYVGTASKSKTKIDGNCCTMLDFCLTLSSWDALTYPSKGGRGAFPEYSAATYLETLRRGQDRDRYFMPYVYLLWNENGQWVQCTEKYRGGVRTTPWKRKKPSVSFMI
jgi:RHS repeat-associated protein